MSLDIRKFFIHWASVKVGTTISHHSPNGWRNTTHSVVLAYLSCSFCAVARVRLSHLSVNLRNSL
uniref:Uncharacterized protein n=1 Tax=Anguilla anguilla TaxID=7936 RepID=A0A0E9XM03_ANGAN